MAGQGRSLGDRMPNLPLWIANGKEGVYVMGQMRRYSEDNCTFKIGIGPGKREHYNYRKEWPTCTWQIPGRPIWEI
jgi:hypothetical protein